MRVVAAALAGALLVGCAHAPPRFDPRVRPTTVVLSVGGADGVAHLGALQALDEAGVRVAAVVGSSMGALVGAVYASAPTEAAEPRFARLTRAYAEATAGEARRNGLGLGLLLGALATLLTSGAALPTLAAGAGFAVGAQTTPRLDGARLVRVMDRFFGGAKVEALPIPFAAIYLAPRGGGVQVMAARAGALAEAVGGSVANPLLFPDVDVTTAARLDPGADRAAAVPVEDACRLFPGHNVLAINVTAQPALFSAAMTCPLLEVRIAPPGLRADEVLARGEAYARAIEAGRRATRAALGGRRAAGGARRD